MKHILDKMQLLEQTCDAQEWDEVEIISIELHGLIEEYFEGRTEIDARDRSALEDVLSRYACLTSYLSNKRDASRDESSNISRTSRMMGQYNQVSRAG